MLKKINKISPERAFALFASFFGLIAVFFFPLLSTPDETAHFIRAYAITKGQIINITTEHSAITDEAVQKTIEYVRTGKYSRKELLKYTPSQYPAMTSGYTSANSYNPFAYTLSVIMISVLKLLNIPIIIMLYMVRIINLAVWILAIFLSMRILGKRKWSIFGIAIMPTAILFAISPGADVLQFSTISLMLSVIVSGKLIRGSENITLATFILLGFLSASAKITSIIVLPLILFYRGFKKNDLIKKIMIIAIPVIIGVLWIKVVGTNDVSENGIRGFLPALYRTVLYSGSDLFTWVIANYGHIEYRVPILVTILGYLLLFVIAFSYDGSKEGVEESVKLSVVGVLIALFSILAPLYAMWSTYTPTGYPLIYGFQGRYIYGALILLSILPIKIFRFKSEERNRAIIVLSILVNVIYWLSFINYIAKVV